MIRIETDSLGPIEVPIDAYYGSHTTRSMQNFQISGIRSHTVFIDAIVLIKKSAAAVNMHLQLLENKLAKAIIKACDEVLEGKFLDQFPIDIYQAGAGTSLHMNVNEVVANRANELLGAPRGSYAYIHPNDQVNMSQSTNDVIPTAIRIAVLWQLPKLLETVTVTQSLFEKKTKQFQKITKSGRTHMQDALPITLGQEFSGYSRALELDAKRIERAAKNLLSIGIGGTAVGTGANSHPEYHRLMVKKLKTLTKLQFVSSGSLFESMQNTADLLEFSSSLRILAQNLIRIGNDLRFLSSGPRSGLAEIQLPAVQPGSSIMPGKVNPSIIEMLTMVCFQVIGYDQAILLSSQAGQLELNVFLPLIAYNLLEQIRILTNAIEVFNTKCITGIRADEEMCRFWMERNPAIATLLSPIIGYAKTAELVKEALRKNSSIKELAIEKGYVTKEKAEELFL